MTFGLGGIAEAFGDRNFRWYSLGSVVSWLSFFVQAVAVSWTAWDLTHSTAWLAIVALADATANVVLMPIGGVLADRGDRLRILMISYACATAQAAILAGLAFSGALTIHALTALAAVHGAAHAFSIPASYGLLPRFIAPRRLSSAIAVGAAYSQLGLFVGPALAGGSSCASERPPPSPAMFSAMGCSSSASRPCARRRDIDRSARSRNISRATFSTASPPFGLMAGSK